MPIIPALASIMFIFSPLAQAQGAVQDPADRPAAVVASLSSRARSYVTPDMDRLIRAGIDDIYRMNFNAAESEFERLRQLNPDHPYAYFGLTAVAWARYIYETEQSDQSLIAPFQANAQTLIVKAQAWIKAHPDDAEAMMTLGAAHGILARLLVTRHQYVQGYFNARAAMKFIRAALAKDPQLYDARLGLGMYDYYTDLYPRLIRILAKIILRGNRARGIETLKIVADKGRYMSTTAKLLLVEIYTEDPFGAQDPKKAVGIMSPIRKLYPESAMMHCALLTSLYEDEQYEQVLSGAHEYMEAVKSGVYRPIEAARGNVILGAALWALRRPQEAFEAFRDAGQVTLNGQPSRWAVWGLIRAGQASDLMGNRAQALECYRKAAGFPDYWGYRKLASRQLSKPYAASDGPLSITPP